MPQSTPCSSVIFMYTTISKRAKRFLIEIIAFAHSRYHWIGFKYADFKKLFEAVHFTDVQLPEALAVVGGLRYLSVPLLFALACTSSMSKFSISICLLSYGIINAEFLYTSLELKIWVGLHCRRGKRTLLDSQSRLSCSTAS